MKHRTLLFAAWTAEERGILGSEYEAAHPLYPAETMVANITLDNRPLFSGRVHFPANVPTGNYEVTVMLFNGGEMVTGNSAVLQVSKGGADAWIYERAHDQAAAYGLCAIAGALLLGWAAHLVFRKI